MCMCYEGECRHKKITPKSILKLEKVRTKAIELLETAPWWNIIQKKPAHKSIIVNEAYYKEVVGIAAEHFIRQTNNKLLFYTGREDMSFMHLNMAKRVTLRHANHIMAHLDVECEAITLAALKKELRIKKNFIPLPS